MAKLSPSPSKCHTLRYQPYKKTGARMEKARHGHVGGTIQTLSREGLVGLEMVRKELGTKTNIVIISGAGISTNAGINDFRSSSRTKMSSRRIFDSSAYSMPDSAAQLHSNLFKMFESASESNFAPFELLMEYLAQCGRIHRHYTQNIDCRSAGLPSLSQKTIWLHGRLDTMMCHRYSQHTVQVTLQSFQQWATAPCPRCEEDNQERVKMGKRSRGRGSLRPKVLLYGEDCPDESEITDAFEHDLRQPVDAIIIVGTRLLIPSLRRFAERLCQEAKSGCRESITLWVNKEPPKLGRGFESLIDYQFLGDCDSFASLVST